MALDLETFLTTLYVRNRSRGSAEGGSRSAC